jgi:hypothetical protein
VKLACTPFSSWKPSIDHRRIRSAGGPLTFSYTDETAEHFYFENTMISETPRAPTTAPTAIMTTIASDGNLNMPNL